jgi:hypothetical protein
MLKFIFFSQALRVGSTEAEPPVKIPSPCPVYEFANEHSGYFYSSIMERPKDDDKSDKPTFAVR